jgi:hypothetical protein
MEMDSQGLSRVGIRVYSPCFLMVQLGNGTGSAGFDVLDT